MASPSPNPRPRPSQNISATEVFLIGRDLTDSLFDKKCPNAVVTDCFKAFSSLSKQLDAAVAANEKKLAGDLSRTLLRFRDALKADGGQELTRVLSAVDSKGTNGAQHLADLANKDAESSRALIRELLERTSRSPSFSPSHSSAPVAVASQLLFESRPAEWLRVMGDISSSNKAVLAGPPGGASRVTMNAPDGYANSPFSGSLPDTALRFDCALKASFAPFDTTGSKTIYSVETDAFVSSSEPAISNLPWESLTEAAAALTGSALLDVTPSTELHTRIQSLLRDTHRSSSFLAQVELDGKPTPVLVVGCAEGKVSFINPNSATITGSNPARELANKRECLERMPENLFLGALRSIAVEPSRLFVNSSGTPPTLQLLNTQELKAFIGASLENGAPEADLLNKIPDQTLEAKDLTGTSVAVNVARVVAALADKPDVQQHYVAAFIERLNHPGTSTQAQHGTCGAESILRFMNITDVGEWSRVVADLVIRNQSTLKGGLSVSPPEDWVKHDKSENRHCLDALLQSSLMQAAAPSGWKYSNRSDKFESISGSEPSQEAGYGFDESLRMINAFSGQEHRWVSSSQLSDKSFLLRVLPHDSNSKPVYAALSWPQLNDVDGGAHAVLVTEVKGNRVYFSNSQGPTGKDDGTVITNNSPKHRIENDATGRQSMDIKTFQRFVMKVAVEQDVLSAQRVKASSWLPRTIGLVAKDLIQLANPRSRYPYLALGLMTGGFFAASALEKQGINYGQGEGATPATSLINSAASFGSSVSSDLSLPKRAGFSPARGEEANGASLSPEAAVPEAAPATAPTLAPSPPPTPPATENTPPPSDAAPAKPVERPVPPPPEPAPFTPPPQPQPATTPSAATPPSTPAPTPAPPPTAAPATQKTAPPKAVAPAAEERRLNREATDEAFDSLFMPRVRTQPEPPPAPKAEPPPAPKAAPTPGVAYEVIKKEAIPLIKKDLARLDNLLKANGITPPEQQLETLKLLQGTFSDYRAALSRLNPGSLEVDTLTQKLRDWIADPAGTLEVYRIITPPAK